MASERKYYIKKINRLTREVVSLELRDPEGRPVFGFRPGQYLMLSYRNSRGKVELRHSFSIASSPSDRNKLDLGIKVLGNFTQGLGRLKAGDTVFATGPFGRFVFKEKKHRDLVMIAGGIGITPFMSTLRYAAGQGLPNRLSLLYSAKTREDLAYYEEIRNLSASNRNFRALFSVTDGKAAPRGIDMVAGRLNAGVIGGWLGDLKGKTFFICGPRGFMDAMQADLSALGVGKSRIKTEEFVMIPDEGLWLPARNLAYALTASAAVFIIAFNLVNRPAVADVANTAVLPDQAAYDTLNQAAYDRLLGIINSKNQSVADLQNRLNRELSALNSANIPSAPVNSGSAPVPSASVPARAVCFRPGPDPGTGGQAQTDDYAGTDAADENVVG